MVRTKRDQFTAFSDNHSTLLRKLKNVGTQILEKQKMYADLANQPGNSMTSVGEEEKTGQGDFMVNGLSDDKNTNHQGYQLAQEQIKISGE
jgi:uncharacterized Zn finger protein